MSFHLLSISDKLLNMHYSETIIMMHENDSLNVLLISLCSYKLIKAIPYHDNKFHTFDSKYCSI